MVKKTSGAKRVLVFDHTLRSADSAMREAKQISGPVRNAHNDYTEWSGPQRVRDLLPDEAEELLKHRFAVIQTWRPIRHPVKREPLAIADARSIGTKELIPSSRVYPDRVGEVYHCTFNPGTPLVLLSQHAAQRSDGLLKFRLDERRPRPLDRALRLRRSQQSARCAAAREHRDAHPGFLLISVADSVKQKGLRCSDRRPF